MRQRHMAIASALTCAALGTGVAFAGSSQLSSQPTSTTGTLFGATIVSSADWSLKNSQFGVMPIYRVYYSGLPDVDAWSGSLPGSGTSAVIVSFEAQPTTILSGVDDVALSQFFSGAPSAEPIYYSYDPEPEAGIAAGQFTAAEYRAAWGHVVSLADRVGNAALHATLILNAYSLTASSHRNWLDYFPGDGIISTLGWDDYPAGGVGLPDPSYLAKAIATSRSAGLPFGFAGFGTVTVAGRGPWLTAMGRYIRNSGAVFGSLYDSPVNGQGGPGTFAVDDAPSVAAWGAVVQGSATVATPSASP